MTADASLLEALEPLTVRLDDGAVPCGAAQAEWALLSLPLVRRLANRVAILGSGTLWQSGRRLFLATAAHLFEHGARACDLGIVGPGRREITWLGLHARAPQLHPQADVAVVPIADPGPVPRHWRRYPAQWLADEVGEACAPAATARPARYVLCGWPAEQAQWSGAGLVARPIVCFTTPHPAELGAFRYGRIAEDGHGRALETPALDGVSGALVWRVEQAADRCRLAPVGIQVSFAHGRLLRCEPIAMLRGLLR